MEVHFAMLIAMFDAVVALATSNAHYGGSLFRVSSHPWNSRLFQVSGDQGSNLPRDT